jgi:hypothetical protein
MPYYDCSNNCAVSAAVNALQKRWLMDEAARRGITIGALLRHLVAEAMSKSEAT